MIFPFTFQGSQGCFSEAVETGVVGTLVVEQLLMTIEIAKQAAVRAHFSGSEKRWSRSQRLAVTAI
jgi:hypothetical protein